MTSIENLTAHLNPPQKKAVETLEGPVLILAGAGSGKTRALTHRMANIIASGLASTDEVLCVTFTNKAAKEMEHRIFKLLEDLNVPVTRELWVNTFHSFCVRVLRQRIDLLDYKKPFTIYDSGDQLALVKRICNAMNINDKMFPPKNFQSRISDAKMKGLTPDDLRAGKGGLKTDPKTLDVYTRYEQEMKRANALDFDDLLLKTYLLFQMYPDVLEMYQNKFRYIMVDEYQDTNHIQYLLVQMLAKSHRNLCVVGDEDQSIYSWRGADISNILDFEKDFPEACIVKLEENYRSTSNIVNAATKVIANNTQRKEKTLFTNNEEGDLIQIREERNEYDEAKFVAKTIQQLISSGEHNLNDYAVFYRTNAQSRVLEEQMRSLALPYRLIGGIRFYERAEVKDVLSYLRLSQNLNDDMALKRIINVPARGIGKTTVDQLEEKAASAQKSLYQTIQDAINDRSFNAGTTGKLRRFLELIDDFTVQQGQFKLSEFYSIVLQKTEYIDVLKKEDTPEAEARISNLEELDNAIAQFESERGDEATLSNYLEELTLASDLDNADTSTNAITLMTIHISKGLEFPYVFIVGCEENLFPSMRGDEEDPDDLEEERRLAYVAMTRARKKLWMTHTKIRRVWGQEQMNPPSRFLKEIPKEFTQFSSGALMPERPRFMSGSSYNEGNYYDSSSPKYRNQNRNQGYDEYSQNSFDDDYSQVTPQVSKGSGYAKGQRVRHPTFGVGSIFSTEGDGDTLKISVLFQDNTIKKFVAKYARLEKV
ncbi:MAG: ATP-dependent helicase [Pseudobdellovibrio sp.]|jgi:DNA helicase-2/ATP-dependent DNA helicase PcrA|nr:ATP-dependent helicase [Pseudobdellovibrio sp.]